MTTQSETSQLTRTDLASMAPEEIDTAHNEGRCDGLIGVSDPDIALTTRARTEVLGREDIVALMAIGREDLIEAALTDRRITFTTGGE